MVLIMTTKLFIKKAIKAILPYGILVLYRQYRKQKELEKICGPKNYCPICKKSNFFNEFGSYPREKAQCPHCGSLERHRLLWVLLKRTNIFSQGKKILHIAPEPCLENVFRKLHGGGYLSADIENQNAMVKMDLTDIQYPNETFDIIICYHVLEHIVDDKKAMTELHRVLKKDGWAILEVPVQNIEKTYEDNSIITAEGRLEAFGQHDHVRIYGRDYIDRLKSVGFNVKLIDPSELLTEKKIKKMNPQRRCIHYCTK